jgi:hypothetical protein
LNSGNPCIQKLRNLQLLDLSWNHISEIKNLETLRGL